MPSPSDLNWRIIGVASLIGLVFIVIAVMVVAWQPLSAIDLLASDNVGMLSSGTVDQLMILLTSLADFDVLLVTETAIVLLLLITRYWRIALASGFVFIFCALAVQTIKMFVHRERPVRDLYEGVSAFSFPSSHAANGLALIAVLIWLSTAVSNRISRTAIFTMLVMIAALIGLSRIYLHAHWASDVIAGYLIAGFVASMGYLLIAQQVAPPKVGILYLSLAIWLLTGGIHAYTQLAYTTQMYLG